mmetsp:Transcript_60798/g.125219  ORF Transcript_60798/g.125219 Transcript_60798/m.125219 type:complete len:373 (+) Transcript_60798:1480-2598(+)
MTVEREDTDSVIVVDSPTEERGEVFDVDGDSAASGTECVDQDGDELMESEGEGESGSVAPALLESSSAKRCKLVGCTLPVYVSREGVEFDFCSRTHAKRFLHPPQPGELSRDTCKLPGCERRVYVDFDGVPFQFCCKSHGVQYGQSMQGPRGGTGADAASGEAGESRALPEFRLGSELVCVRAGCTNSVKAPHVGATSGRMGQGPTCYNFCCRYCKIQHCVGEGTIPFSTTRPLEGAWYQSQVEAAQAAVREEQSDTGESSPPEGMADSPPVSPQGELPGLVVASAGVPEEAVRSVMRCQGLMQRQIAKRTVPYQAQFNGFKRCPLCHVRFSIGHKMVRCYVDPNPECVWVHVDCAQAVVSARGGGKLHPSL